MSKKRRTFAHVIRLERHIEILLLSNDCVIVPDLGGFMAHHVDAYFDEEDGVFVPPIRTLGFNPQLRLNDSLLVQSYIEAYDISYPEALRRIEGEVAELRSHLENEGEYELNGLGLLRLNGEGKLEFEPCEAGILTPELYGLSSIEMTPLASSDAKVTSLTTRQSPATTDSITIKMSWLRNAVAVAAAVIAFLMIGTPVSNSNSAADMQQSAFITVPTKTQPQALPVSGESGAPAVNEEEDSNMSFTLPDTEASEESLSGSSQSEAAELGAFCIVMASQVSERNAQMFISQLEEKGYSEARILVSGNKHIRRVVYGFYESEAEAAATLKQLRTESRLFRETWIMEVK